MTFPKQLTDAQASPEVVVNANFANLRPFAIGSERSDAHSGLVWGYWGGTYLGNTTADGTVTLTNTATNYLVLLRSTGVVSVSTSTTNSLDSLYATLATIVVAGGLVMSYTDTRGGTNGLFAAVAPDAPNLTQSIIIAASDETTDLTTGAAKVTFRMPYAFTLSAVRGSLTVATAGAALQVDINESGTSILSTKLTIDAGELTSTTAATAAVISDNSLADDAEITIDIDAVGSSTAGAGLKVYLIGGAA